MGEMFQIVSNNLIILCICMLAGFISQKTKVLNYTAVENLSGLLLKVTFPCLIVVSMQRPFSKEVLFDSMIVFCIASAIFFFGTAIAFLCCKILKADESEKGVWLTSLTFPNIVYMGLPLVRAIYGEEALFYVSIASISFNLIAFSLGIKMITIGYSDEPMKLKSLLFNNSIIATVIGIVLFTCSISLPNTLNDGLAILGNMTTPLSMIIIGCLLSNGKVSEIFSGYNIYIISLLRLIIIPLIIFVILRNYMSGMLLGVLTILSAMPVATVTAIFAQQYKANSVLASKFVFISTILCLITIPVISLLLS